MNVGFEALPNHADGVANAILRVDQKFHLLVINFRDEHGSLDAADVQSHYIFIFLRQDCSCFYRYLIFVAEAVLVSGLSTTCFAYCKSMEWTRPLLACHCAKFSTTMRYLPVKSEAPK